MTVVWFFIIFTISILVFARIVDSRRKKNNNNPPIPTNPNAKPGDSSNYLMGDNKYTGGGQ